MRSAVTFVVALAEPCSALDTACESVAHRPEPPPAEPPPPEPSPPDGEPLDALSAAPSPAQSIASFARAAETVARLSASVSPSDASDARAVLSVASALATACCACATADGAVPDGTRMLDEPA